MNVFTIKTNSGLKVTLGDLGARIINIELDDISVATHYPSLEDYQKDPFYLGATIGPVANRLAGGTLQIEGKNYQLALNEGNNSLHGGTDSYDSLIWKPRNQTDMSIEFHLSISEDENPLPGSIDLVARYQVQGTQLLVDYSAQTSHVNYLNLTNHVYLNLNSDKQNTQNHKFTLFADSFLITDEHGIPTGELLGIDTPCSYSPNAPNCLSQIGDAVDHHFNAAGGIAGDHMNKLVEARSPESNISATIYSNKAGFQFYTAHHLSSPLQPYDGFCVEPQFSPNAPNNSHLDSPFCSTENPYQHRIRYQFDWPSASSASNLKY